MIDHEPSLPFTGECRSARAEAEIVDPCNELRPYGSVDIPRKRGNVAQVRLSPSSPVTGLPSQRGRDESFVVVIHLPA
jgi:hypothetical protein